MRVCEGLSLPSWPGVGPAIHAFGAYLKEGADGRNKCDHHGNVDH